MMTLVILVAPLQSFYLCYFFPSQTLHSSLMISEHEYEENQNNELKNDKECQFAGTCLRNYSLQLTVQFDHFHLILVHFVLQTFNYRRLRLELSVNVLAFELDRLGHTVDLV